MSATVEKLPFPHKFLAWCEECQDGYHGGKIAAGNWAALHNEALHVTWGRS